MKRWLLIPVLLLILAVSGCGLFVPRRSSNAALSVKPWSTVVPALLITKPHSHSTVVVPPAVPDPPLLVVTPAGKVTVQPTPTVGASPTRTPAHVSTTSDPPVKTSTTTVKPPSSSVITTSSSGGQYIHIPG